MKSTKNNQTTYYNSKWVRNMGHKIMKGETKLKDLSVPTNVLEAVALYIKAYQYVLDYENSGKRYISERLRTNYLGEIVTTVDGTQFVATTRGKPTGTIVAIPTEDGGLLFGASHVDAKEEFVSPIVGLYFALKNVGKITPEKAIGMSGHEARQFERFKLRAMAYFYPDKYSYSRGTEPVCYPKYEEIHKRQVMITGKESRQIPPAKSADAKGRKVTFEK